MFNIQILKPGLKGVYRQVSWGPLKSALQFSFFKSQGKAPEK